MKTPLIEGLSQGQFQAYLTARQYDKLYWKTFFPIKNVNTLDGKTLIGDVGSRVAAMVISYNSKSPEAGRKAISTKVFDIPKVAFKRVKTETQILEHRITKHIQGQNAVIEDYYDDFDFVVDACNAREEFFALQALSKTTVQLTKTNNPQGIVNETVIDFGMPTANKKTVSVIWSTGNVATMDPMADFKAVVKAARTKGIKFTKMLMDADAFDLVTAATLFQVYFKNTALDVVALIDLGTVNAVLRSYNLPEIVIIETSIGIEGKNGTITQLNPWDTDHVTFINQVNQGRMFNGPIAEEIEKPLDVMQAKNENVLVSVKKGFDPVNVTTKGECNVFPSWPNVSSCFSLYTANVSTWA